MTARNRRWWVTATLTAAMAGATAAAMTVEGTVSGWWDFGPATLTLAVITVLHRRDCRRAEDDVNVVTPDTAAALVRFGSGITLIAYPAEGPGQLRADYAGHRCPAGWAFARQDVDTRLPADHVLRLPAGWYGHPPRPADWRRGRAWDCPTCGRAWLARPGLFEVRWRREPPRRTRRRLGDRPLDRSPAPSDHGS